MKFTKYHTMAIVGVLLTLALVAGALLIFPWGSSKSQSSREHVSSAGPVIRDISISPVIDRIEMDFIGDLRVTLGEPPQVRITGNNNPESIRVEENGRGLRISGDTGLFGGNDGFARIEITLPNLSYLSLDGANSTTLTGLTGEELTIVVDGAASITGTGPGYQRISVLSEGAGSIDLSKLPAVDAKVNLDGAGSVVLNMQGGSLSGSLSGLGSIEYLGDVAQQLVTISGLGSVNPRRE